MTAPTPTTKTELLKTQANELIKSHTVYDGSSRPTDVYVVRADAADGDACIRTTYTYSGGTSLVVGRKEVYDNWSSAWDI